MIEIPKEPEELRIYCLMRTDLDMPTGKAIVQGGHAVSFLLYKVLKGDPDLFERYCNSELQTKIILKAKSVAAIARLKIELDDAKIPYFIVTDAGRTVFPEPTVTCMSCGPMYKSQLTPYMKKLQLF